MEFFAADDGVALVELGGEDPDENDDGAGVWQAASSKGEVAAKRTKPRRLRPPAIGLCLAAADRRV